MSTFSECQPILPVSAALKDGKLQIAGFDLDQLAARYDTPLYLYDGATVRHQVESIRSLFGCYPGEWEITYAGKAYFSLGFARKIAALGLGVDVASLRELMMAKRAGFNPERVHLHGNNKSPEALEMALEWGVHSIVVDSLDEMDFLTEIASRLGKVARIWLRITPGMEIDNVHPYMQTGSSSSKFGLSVIDGTASKGIQRAKANRWLDISGLHIHLGSQIYFGDPYANALRMLIELAEREGLVPREISPGGGWGQPYVPEQLKAARPVSDWISAVCAAVNTEYSKRNWPLPKIVIEPGRYIAARAGTVLYRVGTTKFTADGTYFIAVDGGLADNPRPALYTAQYAAIMVDAPEVEGRFSSHIVGKFCESGDELIKGIMMPMVKRWDLMLMPVAGAYHLSMSSNYNMATRPCVLWLEEGREEVLQKRESPELEGWWVSADEA